MADAEPSVATPAPRRTISVLLVTSQWGRQSALEKLLELYATRCVSAQSAAQALTLLTQHKIDVAVVDLDLDGFDGLTLIGHLWRHEPDLPVLVLGSQGQPVKRAAAARAGVSAQFDWPPDPDTLMLAVRVAASQPHGKAIAVTRQLMSTSSALALHASTAQTIPEFLDRVLGSLVHHFAADRGSIFTAHEHAGATVLRAQAWLGLNRAHLRELIPGQGVTGRVFSSGLSQLFLDDARAQPGYEGCTAIGGLGSSMSVPLRARERVVGVANLAVYSAARAFTPRDLETLEFLAGLAAVALAQVEAMAEQSALRQQLHNAEKLTVAGELTAGITHEIKSPLAFVQTNLRTLREYLQAALPFLDQALRVHSAHELPPRLAQALHADLAELVSDGLPLLSECDAGLERMARIIQDLRSMMQPDADAPLGPVRVADTIAQSVKLTRARVAQTAKVQTSVEGDPWVLGSAVQLVQVVVNLINNAADAVTERAADAQPGRVTVRASGTPVLVQIDVEDNGVGMDEATRARAFEPLFSTKLTRGGTGLGMGMVRRIVERHQGRIEVHSEPGKGTSVRLYLPATQPPASPAAGSSLCPASR